jgi:hypothetical protein
MEFPNSFRHTRFVNLSHVFLQNAMLLSFTGLTKVLVTAGVNLGSNKIEVIDLADPTNVCDTSVLEIYPSCFLPHGIAKFF